MITGINRKESNGIYTKQGDFPEKFCEINVETFCSCEELQDQLEVMGFSGRRDKSGW